MTILLRAVTLLFCLISAAALAQTPIANPTWDQLSQDEQRILAPIETEWDELAPQRKLKWLRIAKRFPKMTAEQQARLQDRMHEWVTLSAEQRSAARERYREIEKLSFAQNQALREKWEEYQRESAEKSKHEALEETAPAEAPQDVLAAPETPEAESPTEGVDTQPR